MRLGIVGGSTVTDAIFRLSKYTEIVVHLSRRANGLTATASQARHEERRCGGDTDFCPDKTWMRMY